MVSKRARERKIKFEKEQEQKERIERYVSGVIERFLDLDAELQALDHNSSSILGMTAHTQIVRGGNVYHLDAHNDYRKITSRYVDKDGRIYHLEIVIPKD